MIKIATARRNTDFSSILPFKNFLLSHLAKPSPFFVSIIHAVSKRRDRNEVDGTMTAFRKWRCVIGDDAAKKNDGFEGSHRNETHGLV